MKFEKEILKICQFFDDDFKTAYLNIKKEGKLRVLDNFYSIYRKWYYSSFFDENILTPGHIIYRINENDGFNDYYVPIAKMKSNTEFDGFYFDILNYTSDNHPIVEDLKILADSVNVINIDSDGIICDESIGRVLKSISMEDKLYLEYLVYIGEKLKIFRRLPSIHLEAYGIGKEYPYFFENDSRICFDKIVKKMIDFSVEMLNEFFPDGQRFFSSEYIENIIKNPIPIEEVFKDIYNSVGIDIEEMWDYQEQYEQGDVSEFADAILSSAFFLRVLIDKWFIIPFGDYLKLIMPVYVFSYNFSEKMNDIIDEGLIGKIFDFSSSLYYPCSKYYVTPVACEYFNIKPQNDVYKEIFEKFPMDVIINTVIMGVKDKGSFIVEKDVSEMPPIYEMKIWFKDQKDFWKILEVDSSNSLNLFHIEICKIMNLHPFVDYSFFADLDMNPFSEYTPKSNKKRNNKKTEKTHLSDLKLETGQKLIYRHSFSYDMDLPMEAFPLFDDAFIEIEFLRIKERKKDYKYPRVTKVSELVKSEEESFEF